jgi:flagellar hook-associated protein 3 FlgL
LGAEDRAILAIEIDALKDELFGLVNSKDLNGNYLFSGNKIDSPAFVKNGDGVVSYDGDYGRLVVNVSDVREVALNTLGTEVFSVEEFQTLDSLVDALVKNDGGAVRASIDSLNTISERLAQSYAAMAGRVSALESQKAVLDDTSLRIENILMGEKDLDYATAVTELTKESVALQALQASFSKLAQMTLFNFLR